MMVPEARWGLAEFGLGSAQFGPQLIDCGPMPSKFGQIWAGRFHSNLGRFGQNVADVFRVRPNLADVGHTCAIFHRTLAEILQRFAEIGKSWAEFDHAWIELNPFVLSVLVSAAFGRISPNFGRCPPSLSRIRRVCFVDFARFWPMSAKFRTMSSESSAQI